MYELGEIYSTTHSYELGCIKLATGLTIETMSVPTSFSSCDAYAATWYGSDVYRYATVRQLDITLTEHIDQKSSKHYWTFVVNEGDLEDGESVVLHPHA